MITRLVMRFVAVIGFGIPMAAQVVEPPIGASVRLQFEPSDDARDTPARAAERAEAQRRAQAQLAFEADPLVETLKEGFGASVLPESVRPAEPNE